MGNGERGHGPMQRVREWSSLKPALHSHMVPKYERTQRPFAQLHSSESSSELSPAAEKGVRNGSTQCWVEPNPQKSSTTIVYKRETVTARRAPRQDLHLCPDKRACGFTWVVVSERRQEILFPVGLGLQVHLTQAVEHI